MLLTVEWTERMDGIGYMEWRERKRMITSEIWKQSSQIRQFPKSPWYTAFILLFCFSSFFLVFLCLSLGILSSLCFFHLDFLVYFIADKVMSHQQPFCIIWISWRSLLSMSTSLRFLMRSGRGLLLLLWHVWHIWRTGRICISFGPCYSLCTLSSLLSLSLLMDKNRSLQILAGI